MSAVIDPADRPPEGTDLQVLGALPRELEGRLVVVDGDGAIHWLHVHDGRAVHVVRRGDSGASIRDLVVLGGSLLAVDDTGAVRQLRSDIDSAPGVDLAGGGRHLTAGPTFDPETGEVHLVANVPGGIAAHVVISAGALTRRSRPILEAPSDLHTVLVAGEHVVFVGDGVVGLATRGNDTPSRWITTATTGAWIFHAHGSGDTVELLVLTPALEQWIVDAGAVSLRRSVIDPSPRRFARAGVAEADGAPRHAWTTGGRTISRHDLRTAASAHLDTALGAPGPFALIRTGSPVAPGSGWFVGLVHDAAHGANELRVIDATDLAGPVLATVRIPGFAAHGLQLEWMPSAAG